MGPTSKGREGGREGEGKGRGKVGKREGEGKGGRGVKREGPPCSQPPLLKNPGYGPALPCETQKFKNVATALYQSLMTSLYRTVNC